MMDLRDALILKAVQHFVHSLIGVFLRDYQRNQFLIYKNIFIVLLKLEIIINCSKLTVSSCKII